MSLPERLYYPLVEAAEKMECSVKDIIHYGATDALKICIYIDYSTEENKSLLRLNLSNSKLNEMDDFNNISGDGWSINGVYLNDSKADKLLSSGYYAENISGFFYVMAHYLVPVEFNSEQSNLKLNYVSTGWDDDLVEDIGVDFMFLGVSFPVKNLCVMAKDINELTEKNKNSKMPSFDDERKKLPKPNANKQSKLIKALIEINYGKGASENPHSLLNEERGTGEMLEDFQRMGISPPVSGSTLATYLRDVELDYVEIPTRDVSISKK